MTIQQWADKWGISSEALVELSRIGLVEDYAPSDGSSEAKVQSQLRLDASRQGVRLWRNNVGALKTTDGGWVRYGLCNDSPAMNANLKSSDLIGIRPLIITHDHVGKIVGQFVAREVKRPSWKFRETDKRASAQKKFIDLVNRMGGDAKFNSTGELN